MTNEILAAIKKKKRPWRRDRARGISEEYREMERKVKNLIRHAKRKYEKKLANTKGGGNRQFYAYVKRKTKSKATIGPLKDKNKKVITDDEEMAVLLNDFFSSVFKGGGERAHCRGPGHRHPGGHLHHRMESQEKDPEAETSSGSRT